MKINETSMKLPIAVKTSVKTEESVIKDQVVTMPPDELSSKMADLKHFAGENKGADISLTKEEMLKKSAKLMDISDSFGVGGFFIGPVFAGVMTSIFTPAIGFPAGAVFIGGAFYLSNKFADQAIELRESAAKL